MSRVVIGIDPGLTGGLGVLTDVHAGPGREGHAVGRLYVTPVVSVHAGGRGAPRRDYDVRAMAELLEGFIADGHTTVAIERQGARPAQGVTSSYRTGVGMGLWLGIVAALRVPYELVTPLAWKRFHALVGADKRASRLRAQERFPALGVIPTNHEGPAEGLLIAAYVAARRPA